MTAKEYLNRYRQINARIDGKIDEIAHLRSIATKLSPTARFDKSGNVTDKVGRTVAKIVDLEREIDAEIEELERTRAEITDTIAAVGDERCKTLLTMRYINGHKWEKIALDMHYSYANIVQFLHPSALRMVDKIISEK